MYWMTSSCGWNSCGYILPSPLSVHNRNQAENSIFFRFIWQLPYISCWSFSFKVEKVGGINPWLSFSVCTYIFWRRWIVHCFWTLKQCLEVYSLPHCLGNILFIIRHDCDVVSVQQNILFLLWVGSMFGSPPTMLLLVFWKNHPEGRVFHGFNGDQRLF